MRKVMLLAAMLAMALAAAAPAFGQNVGIVNQNADQTGIVNNSVCSQVYNIAVQQYNAGDQTADADADASANASAGPFGTAAAAAIAAANAVNIANAVGIDVDTVNVCLNNFATVAGQVQYKKTVTPKATVYPKKTVTPKATVYPKKYKKYYEPATKKYYYYKDGKKYYVTATAKATSGDPTLPDTGGASLLALGAGVLLVGGGLLARRIAR
jgi:hypothetical protein